VEPFEEMVTAKVDVFIQLGMTDDSFQLELPKEDPTAIYECVFNLMGSQTSLEEKLGKRNY